MLPYHVLFVYFFFFGLLCLYVLVFLLFLQPSSTLSSYVPACAYSPSNQYGVYSGPAGSYVSPGHHWQAQGTSLSHPGGGVAMHPSDIHSSMAFKHAVRDGMHNHTLKSVTLQLWSITDEIWGAYNCLQSKFFMSILTNFKMYGQLLTLAGFKICIHLLNVLGCIYIIIHFTLIARNNFWRNK